MRSILFACTFVLAAGCGGDDSGPHPDAAPLPACTGATYDLCTDTTNSSDCTVAGDTCHLYMSDGFTECSPTCDGTHPCPNDKNGNAVSCNGMGRCKAAPNACMR